MPAAYKEQITKTFRDDAIRSVLFIDDDYCAYPNLASNYKDLLDKLDEISPELSSEPELSSSEIASLKFNDLLTKLKSTRDYAQSARNDFKRTAVAEAFVSFFHARKFICDVESGTTDLQVDKIRKSDLIILDYFLEPQDAKPSLKLLSELSSNRHMNLVVVYTNQPLKNVWLEIASTLRGSSQKSEVDFFGDDKNSAEAWRDHSEIYTRVWTEISRQQRIDYLLGQETDLVNSLKSSFWSDIQNDKEYFEEPEPTDRIVQFLIEKDLCVKNLLKRERTTQPLHGCDELWIQSGDVFIALCEKKDDDDENLHEQPEAVWDKLNEALHSWYPSFYRVVLSEIQNRIEDSNFSMTKVLRKTHHEQIALLWSILKEATDKQLEVSESIFSHLLEDIFDELLAKSEDSIPEFIKTIASSIDGTIPAHIPYSKERASEHNAFMKELISKAKGNFRENLENFDNDFCLKIAHALNEIQCTKSLNVGYITTGTVLKSPKEAKIHWYVCVTPSCDTVPTQKTNDCAKSLYPHRLLTFVKLNEEDLGDALGVANQSSHIFVTDAGRRVALRVVNPNSKLPDLVKFIVQDHVSPLTFEGKEAISFKTKKKTGGMEQVTQRLIPVAQLKPAYAARFQAIQSHYEGRIGVDYTTVDFSTADHSGESSIS